MNARDRFSMSELVARTGTSAATVRHYLSLGLLPPPQRAAVNRFLYDSRHEQALRIIRSLRERRRLSLPEIRRMLPSLAKMSGEQAFRTEMWDEVMRSHSGERSRRAPSARLLKVGMAAFDLHGFAEVRIDDLCQSAKLAKGSFYRHYSSKEDLFFAAAEAAAGEAGQAFVQAAGRGGMEDPGPVGLCEDEAALALARALVRHLPLILDLLALAAQRRPGHARVAQAVFTHLRSVVRSNLRPPAAPGADLRVVSNAVLFGIRHLIDDDPGLKNPGLKNPGLENPGLENAGPENAGPENALPANRGEPDGGVEVSLDHH